MQNIVDKLYKIADNLYKQNKSDDQIKTVIKNYLRKQKGEYKNEQD